MKLPARSARQQQERYESTLLFRVRCRFLRLPCRRNPLARYLEFRRAWRHFTQPLLYFDALRARIALQPFDALLFGLNVPHEIRILLLDRPNLAVLFFKCTQPLRSSQHDRRVCCKTSQRSQRRERPKKS